MKASALIVFSSFLTVSVVPCAALAQDTCARDKAALEASKKQVDALTTEIKEIGGRIKTTEKEIKELRSQRSLKMKEKKGLAKRIPRDEKRWKKQCGPGAACGKYEKRVSALEKRVKPVEKGLHAVRTQIRKERQTIAKLEKQTAPIEREYDRLHCDSLEAGKTEQATIDKCTNLFSRWNKIQGTINKLSERVEKLAQRYQQQNKRMVTYNKDIDECNDFLEKNCKKSKKLVWLRALRKSSKEFREMEQDLKTITDVVTKYKGLGQKMKMKLKMKPKMGKKRRR